MAAAQSAPAAAPAPPGKEAALEAAFLGVLAAAESLLQGQAAAAPALRRGWLSIARAKYGAGPAGAAPLSYAGLPAAGRAVTVALVRGALPGSPTSLGGDETSSLADAAGEKEVGRCMEGDGSGAAHRGVAPYFVLQAAGDNMRGAQARSREGAAPGGGDQVPDRGGLRFRGAPDGEQRRAEAGSASAVAAPPRPPDGDSSGASVLSGDSLGDRSWGRSGPDGAVAVGPAPARHLPPGLRAIQNDFDAVLEELVNIANAYLRLEHMFQTYSALSGRPIEGPRLGLETRGSSAAIGSAGGRESEAEDAPERSIVRSLAEKYGATE